MKKVIVYIIVLLMAIMPWTGRAVLAGSPYPVEWLRQFGTPYTEIAYGIATDASGNVYVVIQESGVFPGQSRIGGIDALLCKFNSAGVLQWGRQFGTTLNDHVIGVAVDDLGNNIAVVGYTAGAFPGYTNLGGKDGYDAFVGKFNGVGDMQWVRQFGTTLDDYAKGVAIDSSGNIYVGAKTYGVIGQSSAGDSDVVVLKYSSDGVLQWASQFGSPSWDHDWCLVLDSSNNIFVAGKTYGPFPGERRYGNEDAFVSKLNSAGVVQWTREFGTGYNDNANGIGVDAAGNVYVSGYTLATLPGQTSAGGVDAFLRKYNTNGVEQWTRQFGTSGSDYAYEEQSLAVDSSGNAYVVGYTDGAFPGYTNSGVKDAFIRMYNSDGVEQWTYQFGTAVDDFAYGVTVDASGVVYISGITAGAFPGYTNATGKYDALLVKFTPPSIKLALTGYRWSTVYSPKGQVAPYPATLMTWQQVQLSNSGTENAFNVTATITSVPANVTVTDGQVSFGNIPSGGSAWSTDDFALVTDMTQPLPPNPKIVWRVEYDDASSVHHIVENVFQ